MPLELSDRILVEKNENLYSLTIKQVICQEAGQYSVNATNCVGTANASATLVVNGIEYVLCSSKFY
jgi:hypothetical protein